MQAVWPAALAYVPIAHSVHEAAAKLVAPAEPKLPAAQMPSGVPRLTPEEHSAAPEVAENVPGRQIAHVAAAAVVLASGPAKPAAHFVPMQAVALELGACWPDAQGAQSASAASAAACEVAPCAAGATQPGLHAVTAPAGRQAPWPELLV
jgi:hypothetical protein